MGERAPVSKAAAGASFCPGSDQPALPTEHAPICSDGGGSGQKLAVKPNQVTPTRACVPEQLS